MSTRTGKTFGLALIMAVGILTVMFALGTFNAQKAGAQDVNTGTITIDSATPAAGAAVQVKVTAEFTEAVQNYGEFTIELEGYGLPSSIDVKDVLIRTGSSATEFTEAGNPSNVDISGQVITIELEGTGADNDTDLGIEIEAGEFAQITIRKRAGVTAPALAGKYDVSVGDETETNAVTVSPALKIDPKKGGSDTEITVSGKAFADGTGSLWTEALTNPDSNDDGIVDKLVKGDDSGSIPTQSDNNDWGLSVDGGDDADFDLLLVPEVTAVPDDDPPVVGVPAHYVAVTVGETNVIATGADANVEPLGYTITQDADATPADAPKLPAANYVDADFLKDVTVDDGAFSTTIDAGGLEIGGDKGRSSIRLTDADGTVARATFQVTGTVTLGADSVRKGTLLKVSLSDWITVLPDEVTIGGFKVADATDSDYVDGTDDDTNTGNEADDDGEGIFLNKDGKKIDPPDMDDLDDGAFTFYVKALAGVRLGDKTVVLFDRKTDAGTAVDEDEQRLNSANVEITASGLTVAPSSAVVGQEVTVEGRGFSTAGDGQLATITVGGLAVTDLSNNEDVEDYEVLSGGRVVLTFVVPDEVTHGTRTIQVTDDSGRVGEVALTVPKPTITLDPSESRRGTTVTVSGTGFPVGESVTVGYGDEDDVAVSRPDSSGNWTTSFRVPSSAIIGGDVDVEASATVDDGPDDGDDDTTYSAKAEHSVPDKEITVTPEQVQIGDSVEIVGTGFPRYGDVEIKFADGDFRSTNARTDEIGDFTHTAVVPGLDVGTHVLQIRVGDAGASFVLDVVDTPVGPVVTATAELFEPLGDNLERVYHYVNATGEWLVYDPRPEFAEFNTYTESTGGQAVWVKATNAAQFQGEPLFAGWNLIVLQ